MVPRMQQLFLQTPALPKGQTTKAFVESCDIGHEPFPFVFAVASSWFSAGKPLIPGWKGIGVESREAALVVLVLMEIVAHWEAAAGKTVQLQLQHIAAALRRTASLQTDHRIHTLRNAGCLLLDAKWKLHCAAMYDEIFIRNQAPVPTGNLELLVISGGHSHPVTSAPAAIQSPHRQNVEKL